MKVFCEYQQTPQIRKQNEALLIDAKCEELYTEIEHILPSLQFCLAPKKVVTQSGASSLRSSGIEEGSAPVGKDEKDLDKHAKILYEWLDTTKVSRVRMLAQWHSAAGLSFVASVHHRAAQCFKYHGNKAHQESSPGVTLEEFQLCIKTRHRVGSRGMELPASQASAPNVDFD